MGINDSLHVKELFRNVNYELIMEYDMDHGCLSGSYGALSLPLSFPLSSCDIAW